MSALTTWTDQAVALGEQWGLFLGIGIGAGAGVVTGRQSVFLQQRWARVAWAESRRWHRLRAWRRPFRRLAAYLAPASLPGDIVHLLAMWGLWPGR